MLVRIETFSRPSWAVRKDGSSWWPDEPVTGEVFFKVLSCPICGRESNRIYLGERRPRLPQDNALPTLLVWEAWYSPRGAHGPRYLYELARKCGEERGDYTAALLLSPEAEYRWVTTRRYCNPDLWPRYDISTKAGVVFEHESDSSSFLLVWGDILPLPEGERVERPHPTCLLPPRREEVGCQQLTYYPHLGVVKVPRMGIELLVIPSHVKWAGTKEEFEEWGVRLPVTSKVWNDYYLRALEALEKIGLWLYAEADKGTGGLTGRVAVQAKAKEL